MTRQTWSCSCMNSCTAVCNFSEYLCLGAIERSCNDHATILRNNIPIVTNITNITNITKITNITNITNIYGWYDPYRRMRLKTSFVPCPFSPPLAAELFQNNVVPSTHTSASFVYMAPGCTQYTRRRKPPVRVLRFNSAPKTTETSLWTIRRSDDQTIWRTLR